MKKYLFIEIEQMIYIYFPIKSQIRLIFEFEII